ncbi:hypothetical protein FOZG_04656 [Fusarium oxysporum Fo47]|uniref:Uncharacterized protein n=1 Tax=Fusarium oxysporum Fo47 TaxID=660027 RepID=W9KLD1_FUSOX|nr:hypothetical protein FOZG_04656 [Fusarium oxysporum Fo47]
MPKDPRAPQKIRDKTISHLRFNDIADYYNIKKLAKLSTGKIDLILKKEVDFFIIPRIIDEMSTSNRDAVLRSLIVSATARYIEELTSSQVLPTIDLEHHVTIEILEACGERIQQLINTVANINNAMELLKNTQKCRNCTKEFGCYLQEPSFGSGEGSPYVLRCSGCLCRH